LRIKGEGTLSAKAGNESAGAGRVVAVLLPELIEHHLLLARHAKQIEGNENYQKRSAEERSQQRARHSDADGRQYHP